MAKDVIEIEGTILESMPNAMFRVELENGQILSYPAIPTRTNYIFAGWYTNSSCTSLYSFSGNITEDITLYAKWVSTSYKAVSPKSTNEVYLSNNSTY